MEPVRIYTQYSLNKEWFFRGFLLIIENYETNKTFVKIPEDQKKHLLEKLMELIDDANDF